MKFSLVYTSRRASAITQVIDLWRSAAAHPSEIEVVVAVDADYAEGVAVINQLTDGTIPVINTGLSNCVAGWNAAAARSTGDVLIAIADDFVPPPDWDEQLLGLGDAWWTKDHVVHISDGYNPDIFTLAICTRTRYDRFGYLFYPGYESLFSDTEFTAVARLENVVLNGRHLLFEHMHPDCGKRPRDVTDLEHASTGRWKRGEMLFELRRDTGFPLDAGPLSESRDAGYADLRFAAYVQAIRDDFCLYEVVQRVIDEGAGRISSVWLCAPTEYWSGTPQSKADDSEITQIWRRLCDENPTVKIVVMHQLVAPHRKPGMTRIQVETAVRNAAVTEIRWAGFDHILILDGDELWNPGLMAQLIPFIQERRPDSVYTGMVPTIGLPGYPINDAQDKATIYIGPGSWFVDCRGVSGHRHELPGREVIHFTATRRTMAEIISKTRESGHYDDPGYAMEEWIQKVLPNVKPGFTHRWSSSNVGLHMYLPYQVWPHCRAWTTAEWATIPDSLKQYLAQP